MAPELQDVHADVKQTRQRKTHTKSRKGCKNCKLRRVKCDESRPQCNRCINFGVECDYDADASNELQLRGEGAFVFSTVPHSMGPGFGPNVGKDSLSPEGDDNDVDKMLGMRVELHETNDEYHLTEEDLEILRMFRNSTVFTIGTAQSVVTYRREILNLCLSSSHLIHIVLVLTLMHERYITSSSPWTSTPSQKETFHLYHGTGMFNNLLSQHPIREEDKDPLWGSAAIIGAITIAGIEATRPEEAWPMRVDTLSDLDWLRMSDGKKEVWKLVDPLRDTSVWKNVMNYEGKKDPAPRDYVPELEMLYPFLTKIYDFNPMSAKAEDEQDPYHTAASILVRLLELDCNHSNIMYFLSFLGHMDPRFRALLHKKDPRALLLLGWWYGKMCEYHVWWQSRRMILEGRAICLYLEKYHSDQAELIQLLEYPKTMTGLVRS